MAAQKKEETETEQLKNVIPIRTSPQVMTQPPPQVPPPPIRSPDTSDHGSAPAGPPDTMKTLKRPRGEVTRCSGSGCRRRVGLVGFRCRCGEVFCSEHRYSDRHDCSYDYKAAGREAIRRDNPVVRASKLLKV